MSWRSPASQCRCGVVLPQGPVGGPPYDADVHQRAPLYGLDIESDTRTNGLDPARSAVIAVAVASAQGTAVFHIEAGGEPDLLQRLDTFLGSLEPGVLVTWNGGGFDLPFLSDRSAVCGVELGLRMQSDPALRRSEPLPGHEGGYLASWGLHGHLDGYRLYRADLGRALPVSCGLKAVARLVGMTPIEVDRGRIHELDRRQLDAYVGSDAELARALVARRWPAASAHVDRLPRPAPQPSHDPPT